MKVRIRFARCLAALSVLLSLPLQAEEKAFSFGVITQRSPVLTAQYWNPILHYLSERSGIPLQLKLAKTGPDHAEMIQRGEFDFIYSNHNFSKQNANAGYNVLARTIEPDIQGQLIVLEHSEIRSLSELNNKEVVFPSKVAFVGYYVPLDALLRAGITVKPLFAGNQEGALGQLMSGRAVAAAVNSQVAKDYAARRDIGIRVIWSSEKYLNMPISAHPRVPESTVKAIQEAVVGMGKDREGARILAESAKLIKQRPPYGFVTATNGEYEKIRRFYQTSLIEERLQ